MNSSKCCRTIGVLIIMIAPVNTWAQLLTAMSGHSKTVTSVSYSPDGKSIVSGSWDHSIKIWDAVAYQLTATLNGHTGAVTSVSYSPDGKFIASGSRDHSIKVWDARTHQAVATLSGHAGTVTSVSYSPDGNSIVSGGEDQGIKIWDVQTNELLASITGHSGIVYSVAYNPNGKTFISAGWDGVINVWNAQTYSLIKTLSGQLSVVYSAAFSHDGKLIIGGRGDGSISIWKNYRLKQTLKGHSGTVNSVSSHPDGKFIIAGHGDGSINIWDARSFQLSKTLNGHSGTVTSVSFSPNGEEIVSGSGDYLVNLWDFFPMLANLASPPDLYAEISFSEPNDNGYLDADEVGNLHLKITNKGKGDALNLKLAMSLAEENPHVQFDNRSLRHLKSSQSRRFDVPLAAGLKVETRLNALRIEVTEQRGHHMDPLEFAFYTQRLEVPRFVLLGVEIDDDDDADSFGRTANGMVQPGEQIEARVRIQNQGNRDNPGDAHDVEVRLINRSPFVDLISEDTFFKRRLKLGEVFQLDVIFAVKSGYPQSQPLLPLELEVQEKYGQASVSGMSLGIELGKKPQDNPPLVVTRKPVLLGRARFDRVGSKTTIVFEQKTVEEVSGTTEAAVLRENALGLIIGMPDVESALKDADLMRFHFRHALGIPESNIKVFAHGMSRNDFVSLFEQKIGNASSADTELFVFYSGSGILDADRGRYLLPVDGSRASSLARETCYSLQDLYRALGALPIKSKTIIMDICFLSADLEEATVPTLGGSSGNLTVISYETGARANREVQGSDHGLFTHFLAAGLKGGADSDHDRKVTLAEMREFVETKVVAGNGGTHSPTFWTSDGNYEAVLAELGVGGGKGNP